MKNGDNFTVEIYFRASVPVAINKNYRSVSFSMRSQDDGRIYMMIRGPPALVSGAITDIAEKTRGFTFQ